MTDENITISEASDYDNKMCIEVCQVKVNGDVEKRQESVLSGNEHSEIANCEVKPDLGSHKPVSEISVSETNHSNMCNSDRMCEEKGSTNSDSVNIKSEQVDVTESNVQKIADEQKEHSKSKDSEKREEEVDNCNVEKDVEVNSLAKCDEKNEKNVERIGAEVGLKNTDNSKPLENGDIDEPKLSPMVNHLGSDTSPPSVSEITNRSEAPSKKTNEAENDNCSNSSPPVLKAECLDSDEDVGDSESMNSTVNNSWTEHSVEAKVSVDERRETGMNSNTAQVEERLNVGQALSDNSIEAIKISSSDGSCVSETEELSASIVTELMRQDENTEEEAFQRDDPPLCVTPDSRDELGRRCVCISNIIRSLSCVPGNEARICRHPGIMRVLGRLLLLHHSHPTKPPPRKLTCGDDEEEREEPPRVYDDEHWWWDYLDQLRENTLVTLANICGHLKLGNSSEQVCYPLLEGLLHWVICPASVARDPLPTLPSGSVLSPQRLVLEALCKLCIHEINVDLLLATRPVKRLLELFSVLVHLLADRNHQITREFSIVLLSLLVTGESSAARAIALQHPSVSLLVDFLEVAEQNALAIANQQGLDVLQSNPEVMGTSLDMLRRAASILLHMARVPDNRKMFMRQQSRLLNLVMSQILDQSVSNTLSEVLFECSQFS
uniref:SWI/SNF-like complex subunit BAF250 C-terminal domain-containing protein n=1 Tax=Arion vulgaris TaxID=1028688 RepID=A0A0B7BIY1_9EUPU